MSNQYCQVSYAFVEDRWISGAPGTIVYVISTLTHNIIIEEVYIDQ